MLPAVCSLAVAGLLVLAAGPSGAVPALIVPDPDAAIVLSCRTDVRLFRSLRHGLVEYCRGHLRYTPGALDCYQFVDQVCSILLPGSNTLGETRQDGLPSIFRCPDGPEPPVCPRLGVR